MSKTTLALEAAVAKVIESTPKDGSKQTSRQRAEVDRAFAQILKLIAPRIRHFTRQYGLIDYWDDAEQVCAIAVHRAIQAYEPEKAQFTTFVNWQIRGELQSLRFRLMTDQRPSAKKVEATTVSLNAVAHGPDGEETTLDSMIEDEGALALTESGASGYLANAAMQSLVDSYIDNLRATAINRLKKQRPRVRRPVQSGEADGGIAARLRFATHGIDPEELEKLDQRLKRNREIVESRLFEISAADVMIDDAGITKERVRQITKRAAKAIAELAESDPKFALMAGERRVAAPRARKPRERAEVQTVASVTKRLVEGHALAEMPSWTADIAPWATMVEMPAEVAARRLRLMDAPSTMSH